MSKGRFVTDIEVRWIVPEPRLMELLEDVCYIDSKGRTWRVKAIKPDGTRQAIDGSSVPRFFWRIAGSPFVGKHRYASVIHDVACEKREQWTDYKTAHWLYWDAQIAVGVHPIRAFVRWLAVRLFGPRWKFERGNHEVR